MSPPRIEVRCRMLVHDLTTRGRSTPSSIRRRSNGQGEPMACPPRRPNAFSCMATNAPRRPHPASPSDPDKGLVRSHGSDHIARTGGKHDQLRRDLTHAHGFLSTGDSRSGQPKNEWHQDHCRKTNARLTKDHEAAIILSFVPSPRRQKTFRLTALGSPQRGNPLLRPAL